MIYTVLSLSEVRRWRFFLLLNNLLTLLVSSQELELELSNLFLLYLTLSSQLDSGVGDLLLTHIFSFSVHDLDIILLSLLFLFFFFVMFWLIICSAISRIEGSSLTGIWVASQQNESWKKNHNNNTFFDNYFDNFKILYVGIYIYRV